MCDVDRGSVTQFVYNHLRKPEFRRQLHAVREDGSRPIVVLLASDPIDRLVDELDALGSRANVVMGLGSGVLIFTLDEADDDRETVDITGDCTVGVFVARMLTEDGPVGYRFVRRSAGAGEHSGHAELVGAAG